MAKLSPISPIDSRLIESDPSESSRFWASGITPSPRAAPESPLARALNEIPPIWRVRLGGIEVGPELGYVGSRFFRTPAQALLWASPPGSGWRHPAESWRDKGFSEKIWLDDILAACDDPPPEAETELAWLMDPRAPSREPKTASCQLPRLLASCRFRAWRPKNEGHRFYSRKKA